MLYSLLDNKIDIKQTLKKTFYLDESKFILQDDMVNFMGLSRPKELEFLNFTPKDSRNEKDIAGEKDVFYEARFYLSDKVKIQKRVVLDIFAMFGEVGGLNDFIVLILTPFFSYLSRKFQQASIV